MKYFIGFQKKKGLFIEEGSSNNINAALNLNNSLMHIGYTMTSELLIAVSKLTMSEIETLFQDLIQNISELVPNDAETYKTYDSGLHGYIDSVLNSEITELSTVLLLGYINPVVNLLAPDLQEDVHKLTGLDFSKLKRVRLLSKQEFEDIPYNILSANSSMSPQDLTFIEWFIHNGYKVNLDDIVFNETIGIVGGIFLRNDMLVNTTNATNILRIYSYYSDGDPGLKENVKFKAPSNKIKQLLLQSLNNCLNLEDSFKTYREKWLRLLYYLNPMTSWNKLKYSNLYFYASTLRNSPQELETFNAKIEKYIKHKDATVLLLLSRRMGMFTRKLDHMMRVFGEKALTMWLDNNPKAKQLIDFYAHLQNRDKVQERSAILASMSKSEVVTYGALEALPEKLVKESRQSILDKLTTTLTKFTDKVYIAPELYFRPLVSNNRASSFSLNGKANGAMDIIASFINNIRFYCFWQGSSDIDFSAWCIKDSKLFKVGYAGERAYKNILKWSGDNTGNYAKNAEFLDVDISNAKSDGLEWIITEARVFRGPNFKDFKQSVYAGYMLNLTDNDTIKWIPDNIDTAIKLSSNSSTAFLTAYHVPSDKIIYLDVSMGSGIVSNEADIVKFQVYLNKLANIGVSDISFEVLNQGHILKLMAGDNLVDKVEDAVLVFDENTPQEEIAIYI